MLDVCACVFQLCCDRPDKSHGAGTRRHRMSLRLLKSVVRKEGEKGYLRRRNGMKNITNGFPSSLYSLKSSLLDIASLPKLSSAWDLQAYAIPHERMPTARAPRTYSSTVRCRASGIDPQASPPLSSFPSPIFLKSANCTFFNTTYTISRFPRNVTCQVTRIPYGSLSWPL